MHKKVYTIFLCLGSFKKEKSEPTPQLAVQVSGHGRIGTSGMLI